MKNTSGSNNSVTGRCAVGVPAAGDVFLVLGEKKYDGSYEHGLQTGQWNYYNEQGKKTLEEIYFDCDEQCEEEHPPDRRGVPYICEKLGKIRETKEF